VGDFNGDGKLDLVITHDHSNSVSILLGNGDGTFQTVSAYATQITPVSVAVGDFNLNYAQYGHSERWSRSVDAVRG
jgi:hypothetical protein